MIGTYGSDLEDIEMNPIVVAWAESDNLEQHVPLLFNARRNRRLGSKEIFHLVLLKGVDLLSAAYKENLQEAGYILHDASKPYNLLKARYTKIERFGDYERNCFLRWLVIREIFGDSPFIHYDGDVVFNALPEELSAIYQGLTFVLQGCPAFCHVHDSSWLAGYQREFDEYYKNMESYSAHAWQKRGFFLDAFKAKNGGVWDRELISSDQDLLQFLLMDERIPQDDSNALNKRGDLALFQNPMRIARDIHMALPLVYERRNGLDYLSGKKVALWHMQGGFSDYLAYTAFRDQLKIGGRVHEIAGKRPLNYSVYRAFRKFFPIYSRNWIYERFFTDANDLSVLFSSEKFWQEGVFA